MTKMEIIAVWFNKPFDILGNTKKQTTIWIKTNQFLFLFIISLKLNDIHTYAHILLGTPYCQETIVAYVEYAHHVNTPDTRNTTLSPLDDINCIRNILMNGTDHKAIQFDAEVSSTDCNLCWFL